MEKKKILMIEDEQEIINLVKEILKFQDYIIDFVEKGKESLNKIESEDYDLILLDLHLPDIDGFELLKEIRKIKEDLPIIILTGFGTVENVVKAIKLGATDFIEKPFDVERFLDTLNKSIRIKELEKEISKLKLIESILELNRTIISLTNLETFLEKILGILEQLFNPERVGIYIYEEESKSFILRNHKIKSFGVKIKVNYKEDIIENLKEKNVYICRENGFWKVLIGIRGKEKIMGLLEILFKGERKIKKEEIKFFETFAIQVGIGMENSLLLEMLQSSYINVIKSLITSLEAKDEYTKGHSEEVAYYSLLIAQILGLKEKELEILKNSAYLHDLGKVGIKDYLLTKPGKLTQDEFEIIKKHPLITLKILEPLNIWKEAKDACLYHHERIDGTGYPYGLKGDNIPIYSKILAVADAYSAMTSERPYRKKMTKEQAIEELRRCAGTQFDKEIVELFIEAIKNMEEVRE